MFLYQKMTEEKERLLRALEQVRHQLVTLPKGTFYYTKQQNRTKWYTRTPDRIYIQKKQRSLAEQLALRKYLTEKQKDLEAALAPVQAYLDNYTPRRTDKLLEDAEYQTLILPRFQPLSHQLKQWADAPYPQNTKYPEHKMHHVQGDLWVRSKSEAIIATLLLAHGIPFRYECELELTHATYYPDFTLRHPETGEVYYWEHLGLLTQDAYKNTTAAKLQNYIYDGILPGERLILTTETAQDPLSPATVEKLLRTYFI